MVKCRARADIDPLRHESIFRTAIEDSMVAFFADACALECLTECS